MSYETKIAQSRERFTQEVAEHRMEVLRDDGLYRHVRFQRPESSFYWFDIITWPGVLTISGDCGCFVFSRTRDMFEFFGPARHEGGRGGFEDARWGINPQYWSEKLKAPKQRDVQVYSSEVFRERVNQWFDDMAEDLDDDDEKAALRAAVDEQILSQGWGGELEDENEARQRLRDFEHAGRGMHDTWEWDLWEYDWQFLWCCWAIVWSIGKYRAAQPAEAVA